ncbi:MAG: hypothetical protein NT115_04530 [Proteobacteria bacterium]|nr:hypothetical protein [Pseudomonadota bacterium]
MSDATLLYAGIVCFSFAILGMVLTVREFSKIPVVRNPAGRKLRSGYER